ncbi:MAG: hypothetical protein ACREBU_26370, partial [Nitrososphaera sp.]
MILLAFRLARHYWRLGIRQLVLPIGMKGESFPYRSNFVYKNVTDVSGEEGLICGKWDGRDFSDASREQAVYIPLRFVTDVSGKLVEGSTVRYFNYTLGPTVDYRGKGWDWFSAGIRTAVRRAMDCAGGADEMDSDNALVISCEYAMPHLPVDAEADRWIRLTRLLDEVEPYVGVINGDRLRTRFRDVAYARVVSIFGEGRDVGSISKEGRIRLRAGREFSVAAVTSMSPELESVTPFLCKVLGSSDYFELIDDTAEVSVGILNHRWLLRCRRIFGGRAHLRIASESPKSIMAPEIIIPVDVGWSLLLWPQVVGAALIFVGLIVGLVS